jgi:hypothetical protein
LPKTNAWLLSLSHNGGLLNLEGVSTDKETVSQFLTRLENAAYIDRNTVNLVRITQNMVINGIKLTRFAITARTVFPEPSIMDTGLSEFGLPSREEFGKAVTTAAPDLAAAVLGKAAEVATGKKGQKKSL